MTEQGFFGRIKDALVSHHPSETNQRIASGNITQEDIERFKQEEMGRITNAYFTPAPLFNREVRESIQVPSFFNIEQYQEDLNSLTSMKDEEIKDRLLERATAKLNGPPKR